MRGVIDVKVHTHKGARGHTRGHTRIGGWGEGDSGPLRDGGPDGVKRTSLAHLLARRRLCEGALELFTIVQHCASFAAPGRIAGTVRQLPLDAMHHAHGFSRADKDHGAVCWGVTYIVGRERTLSSAL